MQVALLCNDFCIKCKSVVLHDNFHYVIETNPYVHDSWYCKPPACAIVRLRPCDDHLQTYLSTKQPQLKDGHYDDVVILTSAMYIGIPNLGTPWHAQTNLNSKVTVTAPCRRVLLAEQCRTAAASKCATVHVAAYTIHD